MNQIIIFIALLSSLLSCGEKKNVDQDFRRKVSGDNYSETHYVREIKYWVDLVSKNSESIIINLRSNYYISKQEGYYKEVDFVLQADLVTGLVKNSYKSEQLGKINCIEVPSCNSFEINFDQDVVFDLKFTGVEKTIEGSLSFNSPLEEWDSGVLYSHEVQFSGIEKMYGHLFVSSRSPSADSEKLKLNWSPYEGYSPGFKYYQTSFEVLFPKFNAGLQIIYSSRSYSTMNSPFFNMRYFDLNENSFNHLRFRFKEEDVENE